MTSQQLKVGDWITYSLCGVRTIDQISSICKTLYEITLKYSKVCKYGHHNLSRTLSIDYCELWQPQVGEWCWFYTTADDDMPRDYHLVKYVGYQNGRYCFVIDGRIIYKQLKDIEPFIGTLPTFLKDK